MKENTILAPKKPKGFRNKNLEHAKDYEGQDDSSPICSFEYIPDVFLDTDTVSNRYQHLVKKMGDISGLSQKTYKELSEILFDIEQLELTVRQEMQTKYDRAQFGDRNPLPAGLPMPSDTVQVHTSYEDGFLRIALPNTFFRTQTESWHLATLVQANLKQMECEKKINLASCFETPIHILVKRYDRKRKRGYRDNDNFEVTKLINTICSCLDISDAANNVFYTSMFCITDMDKIIGTEFLIFENKQLKKNWKFFSAE